MDTTQERKLNVELLDKVLKQIETNPKHWHQGNWCVDLTQIGRAEEPCETAMCFAGWAQILSGNAKVEVEWELTNPDKVYRKYIVDNVGGSVSMTIDTAVLLGISYDSAKVLFNMGNTLDELKDMVALLKQGVDLGAHYGDDKVIW